VTVNGTEEGMTEGETVMIDGNLLEEMTETVQFVKIESFVNMSQRAMHHPNQNWGQMVRSDLLHFHSYIFSSQTFLALSRSTKSYFVFTIPSKLRPRCS
jgi:hypothetical protein